MISLDNFMSDSFKGAADIAGIQNCSHFFSFAASQDGSLKGVAVDYHWPTDRGELAISRSVTARKMV